MRTDDIREEWRRKIKATRATKLSIPADRLQAVLDEVDPEQFGAIRQRIANRAAPKILLPPAHLKLILDYEPERKEPDKPARVRRQRRKNMDDQADAGAG